MAGPAFVSLLPAAEIAANFTDAHPLLSRDQALVEASRCYFCYDAPCTEACPTGIDVPGFIRSIATGNLAGAAGKILEENIFGGSCARVCPTEILCEGACVRMTQEAAPIAIGALQRVATDWQMANGAQPFARAAATGKHVAVVGAGPAGLACAHGLARLGHEVLVYDAKPKPGGLNEYGIAAYKMADEFARREIEFIVSIGGIRLEYSRRLGIDLTLAELREEFDAVFLGVGQSGVNNLDVAGEALDGVLDAVTFIAQLRQEADKSRVKVGRRVVVIGGGNTAIDAAIQAKFLGAEQVTILYRRGAEQMPATSAEQDWAKRKGVTIRYWSAPLWIEEAPSGLSVVTEKDRFVADMVLKAVGQKFSGGDVALTDGRIKIGADYQTSLPGVFAGGDCIAGMDLTVQAVQDGKMAARAMHAYLSGERG
jgi:glutamate synthase (NADPH/NADH) small chain